MLNLGVVLSGVLALVKRPQIEQPVVLLVSVEVVDLFIGGETAAETLGDDEPVFIDPAPGVRHRQIGAVERDDYRPIAVGLGVNPAAPARVSLPAGPRVGLVSESKANPAGVTAQALRLSVPKLYLALLPAIEAGLEHRPARHFLGRHLHFAGGRPHPKQLPSMVRLPHLHLAPLSTSGIWRSCGGLVQTSYHIGQERAA
jgi:hypothetical protein